MADSRSDDEVSDLEKLGAAIAVFHGLSMPDAPRFDRLAPEHLAKEASIMRSSRPDAADAIDHLAERLAATAVPDEGRAACTATCIPATRSSLPIGWRSSTSKKPP